LSQSIYFLEQQLCREQKQRKAVATRRLDLCPSGRMLLVDEVGVVDEEKRQVEAGAEKRMTH
jgi:hypothetical protein